MPQKKHHKIGLIVDSLSSGGAEKSAAILSVILEKSGYDVLIISVKPEITYNYSGKLIHLGAQNSSFKIIKQAQKILRFRKAVKNNPDRIWLDFRMRCRTLMEFAIHKLVYNNEKLVFTIHNYNIDYHIPKGEFFRKAYANQTITAVSKEIQQKLKHDKQLESVYLPNAIDFDFITEKANATSVNENYIIAIGRLNNDVKQFDVLIDTYHKSILKSHQIKLLILGEGEDKSVLQTQINQLGLIGFVELLGFKANPYPYIKHAKFLALTSRVEGLPMVILEALNLKTPVVAYNCPSGPSEMIAHNVNGVLVENQNTAQLIKTFNELILNPDKLNDLAKHSQDNLLPYTTKSHLKLWQELFKTYEY